MQSFEVLVERVLQEQGNWTLRCVYLKVEKQTRHQIDLVSLKEGIVTVWECRSYLDSTGFKIDDFERPSATVKKQLRLIHNKAYQNKIKRTLTELLVTKGFVSSQPTIQFGLAYGRVSAPSHRGRITAWFERKRFALLGDVDLRRSLIELSGGSYDDRSEAIAAKLLLRSSRIARGKNSVKVETGKLTVKLDDGRFVSVPVAEFPKLNGASPKDLKRWRRTAGGRGIHWPNLDEDLSVPGLLLGTRS